jgi:hypothetical protein
MAHNSARPRRSLRSLLIGALVTVIAIFASIATAQAEYAGQESYVAFQVNTTALWVYKTPWYTEDKGTLWQTSFGMAASTSPSILAGSQESMVAFQTNGNQLWRYRVGGELFENGFGMKPETSPSISGGVISFQANNTDYYRYNYEDGATNDTKIGMSALSSPSATWFRANNNHLYHFVGEAGVKTNLELAPNTSPSSDEALPETEVVAYQAASGDLSIYKPSNEEVLSLGYGMAPSTSPSVAALAGGGYEVAFQTNTNQMWTWSSITGLHKWGLGMRPDTSPSIADRTDGKAGDTEVAFQANNTDLYLFRPQKDKGEDTGWGMAPASSPSISAENDL